MGSREQVTHWSDGSKRSLSGRFPPVTAGDEIQVEKEALASVVVPELETLLA